MPKIDLQDVQHQIDWLKQQLYLNCISGNAQKRIVKRGQVYYCELGTGVGSELQKRRPCLVYQNNVGNAHSAKTVVIPITHTYKSNLSCFVPIANKLDPAGNVILDGYANVTEIRAIDKSRIDTYICDLTKAELTAIDKATAINLDIFKHYQAKDNECNDKIRHIEKLNALLSDIRDLTGAKDNSEILTIVKNLLDKSQ